MTDLAHDQLEHFLAEAISNSPQPLKDLALFLSSALSEDDWKTADRLLLALALRNRTSEPAGDAVAWRARMRPDGEWMVLDAEYVPGRSADDAVEVQPLFTHPAPATADKPCDLCSGLGLILQARLDDADKLRVAVEALERVKNTTHKSTGYPDLSARQAAYAVAFEALAALNEQPQ